MSNRSQSHRVESPQREQPEPAFAVFQAPNGLEIFHHAIAETKYVYREIFEERIYFRNGISLESGESVFDIGANIGLFTIFVQEAFKGIRMHAFEPSPLIFPILKANVARYSDAVSAHACGIASRSGSAAFTFYPRYSIMSGFHAGMENNERALRASIRSNLREQGIGEVQERFVEMMLKGALDQKEEYVCPLRTVSEIIDEGQIGALGLLKIDAEGSELDVLAGIRDEHWGRIRQIVLEIHDPSDTSRPRVQTLLESRGYLCAFEQEQRLAGSGIVNCYARRR